MNQPLLRLSMVAGAVPAGMPCKRQQRLTSIYAPTVGVSCEATQAPVISTLEEVRVDMANMKTECRPVELVTSVGSCVAICLHDSVNKCGGLAHIMLPDSAIAPKECLPFKFANTAVPALAEAMRKFRGKSALLSAKIAGGANMFPSMKDNSLNIGAKNVEAVKNALANNKFRLLAEDVGGEHGRRVSFNVITGLVTVRTHNGDVKKL